MGDKSPKSKARMDKQAMAEKNRKKNDAFTKAHPVPPAIATTGK